MKKASFILIMLFLSATAFSQKHNSNELGAVLDERLKEMEEKDLFSGTVLVKRGRAVVLEKAYGLAQRPQGVENSLETRFNLGSINKVFTAIAILQLVEAEKLSLDDRLVDYVDGFKDPLAPEVTIEHLLRHRSGFGMYWDDPYFNEHMNDLVTIDAYLKFLKNAPIAFSPGRKEEYSNTGFILLGAVIEKVSGKPYFDYINENIFGPLGMKNSGFQADYSKPEFAIGYTKGAFSGQTYDDFRDNLMNFPPKGSPAGGGYSTAYDLLLFVEALYSDRLLSNEKTVLLLSEFSRERGKKSELSYAGGAPGVSAFLEYNPSKDWHIIVLTNFDPPVSEEVAKMIRKSL